MRSCRLSCDVAVVMVLPPKHTGEKKPIWPALIPASADIWSEWNNRFRHFHWVGAAADADEWWTRPYQGYVSVYLCKLIKASRWMPIRSFGRDVITDYLVVKVAKHVSGVSKLLLCRMCSKIYYKWSLCRWKVWSLAADSCLMSQQQPSPVELMVTRGGACVKRWRSCWCC